MCGCTCKPDGHHPDYSKPLDVLWLCKDCHLKAHNNRFAAYGGNFKDWDAMDEKQLKMLKSLKCFLEDSDGLTDVEIMELLDDNGINTDLLITRCNELIKTIKDRRFLYRQGIYGE